jgi:hypothetical protein
MDLDDSVAVVTGASSGIGRATAVALAREGATVVLAARREARLRAVADEVASTPGAAVVVPTDVTDDAAVESLVETTIERFGAPDVLVNAAGVVRRADVVDADPADWRRELAVNLLGAMNVTRLVVREMLDAGSGHVVNVSSVNAAEPAPGGSGYVASKFGLNGFSGSLRQELAGTALRVTVIEPGVVDTAMQPDALREAMRLLDPADVAAAVVYAVSQPDHVTVGSLRIRPTDEPP